MSRLQQTKRSVYTALLALAALFVLAFAAQTSAANETEAFMEEQQVLTKAALAEWVGDNSKRPISATVAQKIVEETYRRASEHRIDPLLILAMMRNESEFMANAVSPEGATGLMQVMPRVHRKKINGRQIRDVAVNIEIGTQILQDCLVRHKDQIPKALNCYSGGGGQRYKSKIAKHHSALRTFLVEYQFSRDQPIVATNTFQEPRQRATSDPLGSVIALVSSTLSN